MEGGVNVSRGNALPMKRRRWKSLGSALALFWIVQER